MPTLTVAGVEEALSSYKSVGSSFIQQLNMVLPRLYAMGMWRDLTYETTISSTDQNFTLPEDAESIISALIDNDPAQARAQFHDYRTTGRNADGTTLYQYGIVDDGMAPAINELEEDKTYYIRVEPIAPNTEIARSSVDAITVSGLDNSSTPVAIQKKIDFETGTSAVSYASTLFTKITEIRNGDSDLKHPVRVVAVNSEDSTDTLELAVVQEANKINSYRRYRMGNDVYNTKKTMRLLVKRQFVPLINSYDIVRPSNLNAIKHGLLGSVAEDNADLERANYHWGVCRILLEEELDAYRGAAKPTIQFDPSGSGSRIPNML
jgi:hypothetical protein